MSVETFQLGYRVRIRAFHLGIRAFHLETSSFFR